MTDTELANNALRLVGHTTIDDIDSTSNETAITCKQLLASCRLYMLRDNTWNRAKKRVTLSADPTVPAFGFNYRYALPSDCLKVIETNDDGYGFAVEGQYLLTDAPTLSIRYIMDIPVSSFDAMMATTLETLLASRLSSALFENDTMAQKKYELYQMIRNDAKATDGQEGSARDAWGATGSGSMRQFRVS